MLKSVLIANRGEIARRFIPIHNRHPGRRRVSAVEPGPRGERRALLSPGSRIALRASGMTEKFVGIARGPTLSLAERVAAQRWGEGRACLHVPHPVRRFDRSAIEWPSANHSSLPSPQGRREAARTARNAPASPSMGEVSFAQRTTEGVRALALKLKPPKALLETLAGLTPSVTLRVTAPPSRGSGSETC